MRRLPPRPDLPEKTTARLQKETNAILAAPKRKQEAEQRYKAARKKSWFKPIADALGSMSGPGERCMFCSGSEASQVEHFKPKAVFPELAMTWENFLWACGICNQAKGNRFPPETGPGDPIIDPVTEYVWDFFFIDEFGNLTPRWRIDMDAFDPRAKSTLEILDLDREALQQTRQQRLEDLKGRINDTLHLYRTDKITQPELFGRCQNWLEQPFQPDVADYFLSGPGREEMPFKEFLDLAGTRC